METINLALDRLVIPARDADHVICGERSISRFYLADADPVEPGVRWPALELRVFHDIRLKRYWAVLSSVLLSDTPTGFNVHHALRSPTRIVLEAVMPRFDQRTFARFDAAAQAAAVNRFNESPAGIQDASNGKHKARPRKNQSAA